ncbi:CHY-type domain-containing protein [Mycena kentingensis (nom. inval.)]|nr:CHY-type domain-containing protein [Mycena kentingensis (nom. inval.)]
MEESCRYTRAGREKSANYGGRRRAPAEECDVDVRPAPVRHRRVPGLRGVVESVCGRVWNPRGSKKAQWNTVVAVRSKPDHCVTPPHPTTLCKHIFNAQGQIRAPYCKAWFDCAECHAETQKPKTLEMTFTCKKAFRKDISVYDESHELSRRRRRRRWFRWREKTCGWMQGRRRQGHPAMTRAA